MTLVNLAELVDLDFRCSPLLMSIANGSYWRVVNLVNLIVGTYTRNGTCPLHMYLPYRIGWQYAVRFTTRFVQPNLL